MTTVHRLVIYTHDGERLGVLTGVQRWELSRALNDMGWFSAVVRADFDPAWLGVDRLIEFWRQPAGAEDQLLAVGFMRYWEFAETIDGVELIRFGGPDQVELLARRIVNYAATTAQSSKTADSDDMIKEIVREACNDPEAGNDSYGRPRYFPNANFSVDPDEGRGYSMSRDFAYRNVLSTIQEISQSSRSYGVPLFFDVVPTGAAAFIFRTWIDVRGVDRTLGAGVTPIIFSKEAGNLGEPLLRFDFLDELSYVVGGGQGEGTTREIDPENSDIAKLREGESIWNKREDFQDARECGRDRPCIAARAFQKLQERRAKTVFSGSLLDTPQSRFGVDWGFGDKVTARYKGLDFDGFVQNYTITVDQNGVETVSAKLDVTEYAYGSPR